MIEASRPARAAAARVQQRGEARAAAGTLALPSGAAAGPATRANEFRPPRGGQVPVPSPSRAASPAGHRCPRTGVPPRGGPGGAGGWTLSHRRKPRPRPSRLSGRAGPSRAVGVPGRPGSTAAAGPSSPLPPGPRYLGTAQARRPTGERSAGPARERGDSNPTTPRSRTHLDGEAARGRRRRRRYPGSAEATALGL